MALTWDLSKADICATAWDDDNAATTESIIWGTMLTGIGHITPANVGEFRARMVIAEFIGKDVDVTPYIGLRTNASYGKDETRAAWLKRVIGRRMDDLVQGY